MPREWDAETYDAIADPQFRWGSAVVDRLELDGTETVLDAGCGSGRVTALVAERFPRGHVVALDGSTAMLETARRRLAPFGDRIGFVLGDLMLPLPINDAVDAIVSTATFHGSPTTTRYSPTSRPCSGPRGAWPRSAVARGTSSAWCGCSRSSAPIRSRARCSRRREQRSVCARPGHGHRVLAPRRAHAVRDPRGARDVLRTVVLGDHVSSMTGEDAAAFTHEVASRLPRLELDYVRLSMDAGRAG